MKKNILMMVLLATLMGCEDASKAIDKAQEAANNAVDSIQEQVESFDLEELDLDKFGDAAASAQALATSIEEALDVDYSNPEALVEVRDHIANAYNCLVDATSESSAEQLLNKVMETIGNEQTESLIDKAIDQAKEAKECVM